MLNSNGIVGKVIAILKFLLSRLKRSVQLAIFRKWWRNNNQHNYTIPVATFESSKVQVGNYSYGPLDVYSWGVKDEDLSIGHFCSIASGVKFILGGNHRYDTVSSYPFQTRFLNNSVDALSNGRIVIEDDVWIGTDATILSGVTIGQGSIVAAGAMVTKSFPPYSIIGGNPAKLIKPRFEQELIDVLVDVDYSKFDAETIAIHMEWLIKPINLELASRLPKRK